MSGSERKRHLCKMHVYDSPSPPFYSRGRSQTHDSIKVPAGSNSVTTLIDSHVCALRMRNRCFPGMKMRWICCCMSILVEELVAKPKCMSGLWGFFGFVPNEGQPQNTSEVICKLCFRSSGSLPKPVASQSGNTSNLLSHLRNHHPDVYSQLKVTMAAKETNKAHEQSTIISAFAGAQPYTRGSKKWKELTSSVTECIAKDMLPPSTVEKEGFRSLVHALDSQYQLPSRKYLSKKAIPGLYSTRREKAQAKLRKADFFAATTDLWSSTTMEPYLSYTVHFITEDWEISSYCMETLFLPQEHTGETSQRQWSASFSRGATVQISSSVSPHTMGQI